MRLARSGEKSVGALARWKPKRGGAEQRELMERGEFYFREHAVLLHGHENPLGAPQAGRSFSCARACAREEDVGVHGGGRARPGPLVVTAARGWVPSAGYSSRARARESRDDPVPGGAPPLCSEPRPRPLVTLRNHTETTRRRRAEPVASIGCTNQIKEPHQCGAPSLRSRMPVRLRALFGRVPSVHHILHALALVLERGARETLPAALLA